MRTMKQDGIWDRRAVVDEARRRGSKKLASVNRDRALAGRYGLYKYPKRAKAVPSP